MPRIYIPSIQLDTKEITITGEDARYLRAVLRAREGTEVTLLDSGGRRLSAVVTSGSVRGVRVRITASLPPIDEPKRGVVLVQGMLKGQKMDLLVQKAVELGVKGIVPVVTERSQVRDTRKLPRWRKIALEASRQSGRVVPPDVSEPREYEDFLGTLQAPENGILFWEEEGAALGDDLLPPSGGNVLALVGPEGGFSKEEVQMATEKGFRVATLGPFVLRAETAGIVAVALIQHLLGNNTLPPAD